MIPRVSTLRSGPGQRSVLIEVSPAAAAFLRKLIEEDRSELSPGHLEVEVTELMELLPNQ